MATRVAGKFHPSARVTPANAITSLRLLAAPVVVVLIVRLHSSWVTVIAWGALASTDFLDGWVARRQGATRSGAFLDPLADKFLVLGALAALAAEGMVSWVVVALTAGREVVISAYRSLAARGGVSVPARPLAKVKTALQDVAIALVLLPPVGRHHRWIGVDLLWVAVVVGLVSAAQYLLDANSAPAPVVAAGGDVAALGRPGGVARRASGDGEAGGSGAR